MQNFASKILCIFVTGGAYTHPTPLVCLCHWTYLSAFSQCSDLSVTDKETDRQTDRWTELVPQKVTLCTKVHWPQKLRKSGRIVIESVL